MRRGLLAHHDALHGGGVGELLGGGHEDAVRLRQISELRFAREFSPEAFSDYISENRKGILTIERLPAENDTILERIDLIRDRDNLYVDTNDQTVGLQGFQKTLLTIYTQRM